MVKGTHSIDDNLSTKDGVYAAHTLGCNTGSIGISMACMLNAEQSSPSTTTKFPMTGVQVDEFCALAAKLCTEYKIDVSPNTVLCHSEVQHNLGIKQKNKWDIEWLPWPIPPYKTVGDYLRARIKSYQKEGGKQSA